MALVFQQLLTEATGDASYLVGDDSARLCAVVDPQIDVGRYLNAAREHGLAIRYVIQTHTHEDFVSGAAALAARAPGAEICVSGHAENEYGFEHRALRDGDELELGSVRLQVRHTAGHTPEHIALVVGKKDDKQPFAVLSGGALLVGTAGRTDLLGPERTDGLTRQQFRRLREVFLRLPASWCTRRTCTDRRVALRLETSPPLASPGRDPPTSSSSRPTRLPSRRPR